MKKRVLLPLLGVFVFIITTSYKPDFFEIAKQIEIFTDVFKQVNMNYVDETSPSELMDVAITAMFDHLDPYTHFWSEQEVEKARIEHSGNYTGIGANVESKENKIIIKEPFKGLPADKAGLKAGDEIVKIGEIEVADFQNDAGELLKGTPGTSVELTFRRQGKTKTTTLKRENVKEHVVPFYKLINGDIGYIKLNKFGRTASQETKNALKDLKAQGAQKIILDLRGNPGGFLSEAVNTANLFLPKDQLIVSTKSIIKKYNKTYSTKYEPVDTEIPLAVLINSHSASASEIVSGSLQDLDRAVVIGSRSFGKGLVQRPRKLKYGAQMKLTISRYYTPSGRCIQALDYWHRDKNGNPVRAKANDYNEFKTRNGRKVYDAGGVFPDIKVEASEISGITQALLEKNAIFNFATNYYYGHDLKNPEDFTFSGSDFKTFKKFLEQTDFNYETKTEKELKKALKTSEEEGLKDDMQSEYSSLMSSIKKAKAQKLDTNKAQIEQQLTDEIIKRYFYEEGYYEYAIKHNPDILKAENVLNDTSQYDKILSGNGN